MTYSVLILPRAQKELERIRGAVLALAQNPRPVDCTKLKGREGWRIRQGDYRVIYDIDDHQKKCDGGSHPASARGGSLGYEIV